MSRKGALIEKHYRELLNQLSRERHPDPGLEARWLGNLPGHTKTSFTAFDLRGIAVSMADKDFKKEHRFFWALSIVMFGIAALGVTAIIGVIVVALYSSYQSTGYHVFYVGAVVALIFGALGAMVRNV